MVRMTPLASGQGTLADMVRALRHGLAGWWHVVHLGAVLLVLALSPSSYTRGHRAVLARHVYLDTAPVLPGFTVLTALVSLVLIRIVVVTAVSYGLSQYALEMVVRVLVLELIPLTAALYAALRCTVPNGAEITALRASGAFDALRGQGVDPLRREVLPRAVSGVFSVLTLAAVSCLAVLVIAYLSVYGFTPWAFEGYTRTVGKVFGPSVSLIFGLKTLFFALAVTLIPLAAALDDRARPRSRTSDELRGLVRMAVLILLIEAASLAGNYA